MTGYQSTHGLYDPGHVGKQEGRQVDEADQISNLEVAAYACTYMRAHSNACTLHIEPGIRVPIARLP